MTLKWEWVIKPSNTNKPELMQVYKPHCQTSAAWLLSEIISPQTIRVHTWRNYLLDQYWYNYNVLSGIFWVKINFLFQSESGGNVPQLASKFIPLCIKHSHSISEQQLRAGTVLKLGLVVFEMSVHWNFSKCSSAEKSTHLVSVCCMLIMLHVCTDMAPLVHPPLKRTYKPTHTHTVQAHTLVLPEKKWALKPFLETVLSDLNSILMLLYWEVMTSGTSVPQYFPCSLESDERPLRTST